MGAVSRMSDTIAEDKAPTPFQGAPENRERETLGHLHAALLDDDLLPEDQVEKSPIWLVTFGDVTALMLAFFVMLYSMSHLQSEKWEAIISILATSDELKVEGEPRPTGDRTMTRIDLVSAFPTGYLQRILQQKFAEDPLLATIRMTGLEEQLVLSLPSDRFFRDAGVEMSEEGTRALRRLAIVFGQFGNRMDIRGHTDPSPPQSGSGYRDNWDLSLGRALAVAKALNGSGYPGDFTVIGQGDSTYRHIDRGIPEAERLALARRIDIVIVPEARGQ